MGTSHIDVFDLAVYLFVAAWWRAPPATTVWPVS